MSKFVVVAHGTKSSLEPSIISSARSLEEQKICGTTINIGQNGDFLTINEGLNYAISQGVSNGNPYVLNLCGPNYTENVQLRDGVTIEGNTFSITGQIQLQTSGFSRMYNLTITPPDNNTSAISANGGVGIFLFGNQLNIIGSTTVALTQFQNTSGNIVIRDSGINQLGSGSAIDIKDTKTLTIDQTGVGGLIRVGGYSSIDKRFGTFNQVGGSQAQILSRGGGNEIDLSFEYIVNDVSVFDSTGDDSSSNIRITNTYWDNDNVASPLHDGDATFSWGAVVNAGGGAAPTGANVQPILPFV